MLDLLDGMPNMMDSREYISTLINLPDAEHYSVCHKALDKEMLLFICTVSNQIFYKKHFTVEHQIKALEKCRGIIAEFYDDGNFGSCYRSIVYLLGDLGRLYSAAGDDETAVKYLTECVLLAKKHDALPQENEHNSTFMQGYIYKKTKYGKTLCERMKRIFLNDYQKADICLSDELVSSKKFEEILNMLN